MKLLLGDLIFVSGSDWISHEIESITKSKYSHVAVFVGNNQVIEAQGFRKTGYQALSYYAGKYDVWTLDSLTDSQRKQIVDFCKGKIGEEYDYTLILGELLRYELDPDITLREHANRVICSTLANEAYKAANETLTNIGYPSPQDLVSFGRLKKVG